MRLRAFTLIELLAATALAGVLMVGVLGVITSLGRTKQQMRLLEDGAPTPHIERFLDLLRLDLTHGELTGHFRGQGPIEIAGHGGLDPRALTITHRPASIVYGVRELGGALWLVREQTLLDEPTNRRTTTALVLRGVSAVALTPGDLAEPLSNPSAQGAAPPNAGHPSPSSSLQSEGAYTLILTWSDTSSPPFHHVIHLD